MEQNNDAKEDVKESKGKEEDNSPSSSPTNSEKKMLRAIVIGGTGAVGKTLVTQLVQNDSFSHVTTLGRKEVPLSEELAKNPKLSQKVVNMDKLSESKQEFENKDVAFCCLGTTRKDAGSAEAFRKIDLHLVTEFAKLAKDSGVNHMNLLTSSGANANSFFLYMKTKGEVEEELKKLDFPRLSIYRPGLLDRGKEARFIEKLAGVVTSGIPVSVVARAMMQVSVKQATENKSKMLDVLSNSDIRQAAK